MVDKRYLSWNEYAAMVDQLAARLDMSIKPFDELRAIPRGGLIPAVCLSHRLHTPYTGEYDLEVARDPNELSREMVLVDDILDTGKTMCRAMGSGAPAIVAVVIAKPAGVEAWYEHVEEQCMRPDLAPELIVGHVHNGPEWIVFPYENQETEAPDDSAVE